MQVLTSELLHFDGERTHGGESGDPRTNEIIPRMTWEKMMFFILICSNKKISYETSDNIKMPLNLHYVIGWLGPADNFCRN